MTGFFLQGLRQTLIEKGPFAFFLDVDGTLLDFHENPEGVLIPGDLPPVLDRIHNSLDGALALVTARDARFIDRSFPSRLPLSAEHGCQIRHRSKEAMIDLVSRPDFSSFSDVFQRAVDQIPGAHAEIRDFARVFHWRTAIQPDHVCKGHFLEAAKGIVSEYNAARDQAEHLHVTHGAMVLEIGPCGTDKGRAVEAFMSRAPFQGRCPVFIGDSPHSDGFGMRKVREMGGVSIGVGPAMRSAEGKALTDYWIPEPKDVRECLADVLKLKNE